MLKLAIGGVVLVGIAAVPSAAQVLYGPDAMEDGTNWGTNANGTDFAATFNYDYSADGIPEAPSSAMGSAAQRGLKLEANLTSGSAQFFTMFPTGQNFTGNYQLRFDAWMNFDADEVATGSSVGTTEFLGGGVGYDGVTADIASGAQALATGDGGSASDWRAFKDGFFVAAADMAGGGRNGADAYYSDFLPSVPAPGAQGQTAGSVAGSPGLQWVTWQFTALNNTVAVDIIKPGGATLRIAELDGNDTSDGSTGFSTDGNISIFYADFFSSVSPRADLTFGLIDNVVVEVPAPGAAGVVGVGLLAGLGRRRRR